MQFVFLDIMYLTCIQMANIMSDNCISVFHFSSQLKIMKGLRSINPLSPHDALKHHFTSPKTKLIFLQQIVLERKFP